MKLLEINHLTKRFGGLTALDDVTAQVGRGEIVGIIGPNGAGKTTMFNVISGTYRPDSGSIIFEGQNIENLQDYQICQRGISRTYQLVKPFNELTVLENVLIGSFRKISKMQEAREFSLEILDMVNLGKRKDDLVKKLTLPEKKELELARVLATQPKLILLDEVMAGLNPKEQNNTIELILKINQQGITMLVIEHKMKIIMSISNRLLVFHFGQKIAEGPPEHVANLPEVIEAYLGDKEDIA